VAKEKRRKKLEKSKARRAKRDRSEQIREAKSPKDGGELPVKRNSKK
jgi:hypothetical protein